MLLPDGISHCTKANKGYLRGFTPQYMDKLGKQFFDQIIVPRISHKAIDCINEHRDKGQTVILLSGMPQFLLSNFAGFLGIGEYLGSVMETVDGAFDGKTRQPFPLGKGKIAALKLVLDRSGVDWEDLTFYADHWLDRFLLTRVGHPIVVNPHPRLLKLARQKGWQVAIFD
jgi:HAD superfamily hydrolase (TIGR01490 family)